MSDDDVQAIGSDDSDAEEIARLQQLEQKENEYESSDAEENDEENDDEDEAMDSEEGESDQDDLIINEDSEEDNVSDASDHKKKKGQTKSGKKALRAQLDMEKTIRAKEAQMRSAEGAAPTSVNDFERLLVADYDQSYLWI